MTALEKVKKGHLKKVLVQGAIAMVFFVYGATPTVNAQIAGAGTIEVSLFIFSGIPDPGWEFYDPDDIATLRQLIANLPETSPPNWSGFGYRGFALYTKTAQIDFPTYVAVFQGVVQINVGENAKYFQDVKGLETFLISEAQKRLPRTPSTQ